MNYRKVRWTHEASNTTLGTYKYTLNFSKIPILSTGYFLCFWWQQQAHLRHADWRRQVRGPVCAMPRKCSASKHTVGTKDHTSIQMNVAKADKVTGRFNCQFKPRLSMGPFAGWVSQMTPSSNWPRPRASFQRTSDWRGSWVWNIHHK